MSHPLDAIAEHYDGLAGWGVTVATAIRRDMIPVTIGIQEVWDAAGGQPGFTPTREHLLNLLRELGREAQRPTPLPPGYAVLPGDYLTHHGDWRRACCIALDASRTTNGKGQLQALIDSLDMLKPPMPAPPPAPVVTREFSRYYKDVRHLDTIDVYRVLQLWGPLPEAIQHAIKKLLNGGGRGAKDTRQDYHEAIASVTRALEMLDEDERK